MTATSPAVSRPTPIRQEDLIQSVADALQYISYYHPVDYIRALSAAYEREESPAAKEAMAQILINSRMCAEGHRPICQDTGIVIVFLEIGMDVRWDDATMGVEEMVHEGVRRASRSPMPTGCFQCWPSVSVRARVRCRAASSRCCRLRELCWATLTCW